jgi:hypothetical protein
MARADKDKLNLAEVTAIGIGGIFAVLGLAIATAGHAVALTLAGGGVIALLTGLSYAHLLMLPPRRMPAATSVTLRSPHARRRHDATRMSVGL